MRFLPIKLFSRVATIAIMAATLPVHVSSAQTKEAVASEELDSGEQIDAMSLAGAFLAARTAETDNDIEQAIRFYSQALAFDPENTILRQSLMLSLISGGQFTQSIPHAQALKDDAEMERYSRLVLGVEAIRNKQYAKAANWLELIVASDLDRLITGVLSSWAKLGDGKASEAIADLEKLEGPSWFGLFKEYHSALIADAAGMKDAGARYQRVIDNREQADTAPDTWFSALEAYISWLSRNGKRKEALQVLDLADQVAPQRPAMVMLRERVTQGTPVKPKINSAAEGGSEVMLNIATALNRRGGEGFVRLYLQYGHALAPKNDAILMQLAFVSEQLQDSKMANFYYQQIPETSPYHRMANLQIGLNLADQGQKDEAIEHLKAAIEEQPEDMRAYLSLGGVYGFKEDYANAAKVYDQAVAHLSNPKKSDWNVFYQRGMAYERLKQWDKAEPNFFKALELFPNQPQVLNYLGYSWIDMGINLEKGMDLIRKAVDARPNDGYIVDSLGWVHYRLGDYEEAVKELERAVRLKPDDSVINDHLGDAYWRVGRKLEAKFQWSHARDLKPEDNLKEQILQKLDKGMAPLKDDETVSKQ